MASFYVICFAASPSGQTWYHEQQGRLYLHWSEGRLYLTRSEGRLYLTRSEGRLYLTRSEGRLYLTWSEGRLYLTRSEGRLYLTRSEKATDGRVSARPHCALGCSVVFLHQILWAEWGRGREGGREERRGEGGEGRVQLVGIPAPRHDTAWHSTHTRTRTRTRTHTHTHTQHLTLSYWHNPSLMTSASSLVTLGRLVKLPVRSPDGCFLK